MIYEMFPSDIGYMHPRKIGAPLTLHGRVRHDGRVRISGGS
jgi:hypothetical protein